MSDSEDDELPAHNTADLPDVTDDLIEMGSATRADGECGECSGQLWNVSHDTICANCSLVIGSVHSSTSTRNRYSVLPDAADRSKHSNSERPRCPGGFPHAYDWGGDPDDADQFYDD